MVGRGFLLEISFVWILILDFLVVELLNIKILVVENI